MPSINKYRIAVAVLSVAVIVLLAVIVVQEKATAPTVGGTATSTGSSNNSSSTAKSPSSGGTTSKTGTGSTGGSTGGNTPVSGFTVHLLTPIPNATWTIAGQNLISWDRAGNVTGHLDLLDAKTKALVGVILTQVGPRQTSYTWTARFMLISRNSPTQTSVVPGTYLVRLVYDGNNIPPVTSGPVTIVAATQ